MRADALRNRTTILDTARALIAEVGPEASMEEIATRAGVAVGTLYRHFPGKDELVAAVMAASVDGIAIKINAALRRAQAGASPRESTAWARSRPMPWAMPSWSARISASARAPGPRATTWRSTSRSTSTSWRPASPERRAAPRPIPRGRVPRFTPRRRVPRPRDP